MGNLILTWEQVPEDMAQVLREIDTNTLKDTCDLPECNCKSDRNHGFRMGRPKAVDFFFCSPEHRQAAITRWNLPIT